MRRAASMRLSRGSASTSAPSTKTFVISDPARACADYGQLGGQGGSELPPCGGAEGAGSKDSGPRHHGQCSSAVPSLFDLAADHVDRVEAGDQVGDGV